MAIDSTSALVALMEEAEVLFREYLTKQIAVGDIASPEFERNAQTFEKNTARLCSKDIPLTQGTVALVDDTKSGSK